MLNENILERAFELVDELLMLLCLLVLEFYLYLVLIQLFYEVLLLILLLVLLIISIRTGEGNKIAIRGVVVTSGAR